MRIIIRWYFQVISRIIHMVSSLPYFVMFRWRKVGTRTKSWIRTQRSHLTVSLSLELPLHKLCLHEDVIKWKHFLRYWPFARGIHQSPDEFPSRQWRGALMAYMICALNKRLSKQSWGWWFETPSCSLWRHCNVRKVLECRVHLVLWLKNPNA